MTRQTRRSQRTVHTPLDHTQSISNENLDQIALATHQSTNPQSQSDGQDVNKSIQPIPGIRKRKRVNSRALTNPPAHRAKSQAGAINCAQDIDGHLALELTGEGDTEVDEAVANVVEVSLKQRASIRKGKQRDQGKRKRDLDQQTDPSAFQPCNDDDDQSLPDLDPYLLDDFNVDTNAENADDWVSDKRIIEISCKDPSKITETMAIERPTRKGAGPALGQDVVAFSARRVGRLTLTQGSSGSSQAGSIDVPLGVSDQHIFTAGAPGQLPPCVSGQDIPTTGTPDLSGSSQADSIDLPLDVSNQHVPTMSAPAELPPVIGNATVMTDLVFIPGSSTLRLNQQHPLVRLVIHSSFEILHSLLVSIDAFPDGALTIRMVKAALLRAAEKYKPGTAPVYERLKTEHVYFRQMLPLPRIRISTFRSEIKDHCCSIVAPAMAAIGEPSEIARYVNMQLKDYKYTCPPAPNFPLSRGLVRQTLPFRNDRIIMVLRKFFFSGGSTSFVVRFSGLFTKQDGFGSVRHEVPLPMVCLVATVLYAALLEWQTGEKQRVDFTASMFLDVYSANVATLKHIMDCSVVAYHRIMEDIYTLANASAPGTVGTAIAPINVEELE